MKREVRCPFCGSYGPVDLQKGESKIVGCTSCLELFTAMWTQKEGVE